MARKRPTSLLVFGILHITFGTLSLLGALCGGIYLLSGVQEQMAQTQNANAALTKDPQEIELAEYQLRALGAQHKAPFYDANLAGTSVLNVVLCTLLIVGGIGLIKVAPWARAVSLTYAVLSILSSVWAAIYNVFILLPAMNAFLDAEVQNAGPLLSMTIRITRLGIYVGPVMILLYFIYPTLVLAWMLPPPTAQPLPQPTIYFLASDTPYP